jgi:predicted benzoate:H+ symporter BenE
MENEAMRLWHFMMGGGVSMWFVLLFASFTLAAAIGFARRPDARREDAVRSFSWATAFSIASGVCLNLATVGSKVPAKLEWANSPKLPLIVMQGIAESLAPAILGFMLLSLAWTLMAVGHRQLSRESPPV